MKIIDDKGGWTRMWGGGPIRNFSQNTRIFRIGTETKKKVSPRGFGGFKKLNI